MNKFTKRDLFFSVTTGLITGVIAWRIFAFLGKPAFFGVPTVFLVLIIPVLWILGVNLGYSLGRWMKFFNQFGRYAAVGFTNFAVDSGVLYLLIGMTRISGGVGYGVFKMISFLCAVSQSYVWNRNWVFGARKNPHMGREFLRFMGVMVSAIIVNLAIAYAVVNVIKPHFGVTPVGWAGVGAIAGSACALLFSFVGFKSAVFPEQNDTNPQQNMSSYRQIN